jgi:hypothetical protein
MTPTIESVGLRKRFGKTAALASLDLVPSRGAGPGRARRDRQTNDLGSIQDVHAPPAGRAPYAGASPPQR